MNDVPVSMIGGIAVEGLDDPGAIRRGALAYRAHLDEWTIVLGPTLVLRIGAGRDFAEAVIEILAQAREEVTRVDPTAMAVCPACGAPTLAMQRPGGGVIALEPAASVGGIYVVERPGEARLIKPHERPTGRLFDAHRCRAGGKRA